MSAQKNLMMQFKITLRHVRPSVWRRVQVPSTYSFWDLHCAIQDAMGWTDSHLHDFDVKLKGTNEGIKLTVPDENLDDFDIKYLDERRTKLADWFPKVTERAIYSYDFGDNWRHDLQFEGFKPDGGRRPLCLGGKNACPPEDSGGPWGYADKLAVIKDPDHPEYRETREWLCLDDDEEYDAAFDPKDVYFLSPRTHWKHWQMC